MSGFSSYKNKPASEKMTLAIRSDASITTTVDGSSIRNFFAVKRLGGVL